MTDEKADRRRAGAIARAKSLSPEERSGIARKAALTRHRKDMPRAIAEGTLWIGEIAILVLYWTTKKIRACFLRMVS